MRALLLFGLLMAACTDKSAAPQGTQDLSVPPDMAMDCVSNPVTSVELLNACTTADSVDKMPFYPTRAPNGQLPPLP